MKSALIKDLLVLVATGFEDTELIAVLDVLARAGVSFDLASVEDLTQVHGSYHANVSTLPLSTLDPSGYRGIFLPGGKGVAVLAALPRVTTLVKQFMARSQVVAAICAAPQVLLAAGLLAGRRYTAYPGVAASATNTHAETEQDGKLLTGRDFRAALVFADALVLLIKAARPRA